MVTFPRSKSSFRPSLGDGRAAVPTRNAQVIGTPQGAKGNTPKASRMSAHSYDLPTNPTAEIEVEVREGYSAGQRHVLKSFPAVLGRGQDADVRLDDDPNDPTISRRHLRISREGGRFMISDLSTNGTWVGKRQLSAGESVAVEADEPIWLGPKTMLVLRKRDSRLSKVGLVRDDTRAVEEMPPPVTGPSLCIRALGPFIVSVDGIAVEEGAWQARKAIVLLTVLAEHFPRQVAVDRLETWLWPDAPESARSALQKTVSRLRRALRANSQTPDPVRLEHTSYGISPVFSVDYDVTRFDAHCLEAARAQAMGDADLEADAWSRALALYRGGFLEQHADDWVESRRRMLQMRHYEGAESLADLHIRRGTLAEGIQLYMQVLTENPCRESSQLGLMRALVAAGRREEAIRAYQGFVKTLKKTLELAPGPELVALYESLRL